MRGLAARARRAMRRPNLRECARRVLGVFPPVLADDLKGPVTERALDDQGGPEPILVPALGGHGRVGPVGVPGDDGRELVVSKGGAQLVYPGNVLGVVGNIFQDRHGGDNGCVEDAGSVEAGTVAVVVVRVSGPDGQSAQSVGVALWVPGGSRARGGRGRRVAGVNGIDTTTISNVPAGQRALVLACVFFVFYATVIHGSQSTLVGTLVIRCQSTLLPGGISVDRSVCFRDMSMGGSSAVSNTFVGVFRVERGLLACKTLDVVDTGRSVPATRDPPLAVRLATDVIAVVDRDWRISCTRSRGLLSVGATITPVSVDITRTGPVEACNMVGRHVIPLPLRRSGQVLRNWAANIWRPIAHTMIVASPALVGTSLVVWLVLVSA